MLNIIIKILLFFFFFLMEICCRPVTHVFEDKVQALKHQTSITGQMDLGSWLSEIGMLWLSVLQKTLATEQQSSHV